MIPNPDREPKKGELYKWVLILEYNSYMGIGSLHRFRKFSKRS